NAPQFRPRARRREGALLACRGDHLGGRGLAGGERGLERIAARKRRGDLRHRRRPRRRLLFQTPQDDPLAVRSHARRNLRKRRGRLLGVLAPELSECRAVEGLATRVQLVENEAPGGDVTTNRRALSRERLW